MTSKQETLCSVEIICNDKYESQKLASIVLIKESKQVFIKDILNVYDNEVVVSLLDKSAHSITLRDSKQAEKFVDFMQPVIESNHKIINAVIKKETIEIIKEN